MKPGFNGGGRIKPWPNGTRRILGTSSWTAHRLAPSPGTRILRDRSQADPVFMTARNINDIRRYNIGRYRPTKIVAVDKGR